MIENILRYYRACMADSERMDLSKKTVLEKGVSVSHLSNLDYKLVCEKFKIKIPKEIVGKDPVPLPPVPIIISPLSLLKRKLDDKLSEKYQIFPYWIPALLTENNQLIPPVDDNQIPWISRGVLEPNDYLSAEMPTLASLEKVDEISSSFIFARSNWEQYWKSAQDYFKNITGNSWNQLKCEPWVINDETLWVLPVEIYGVGENILNLYDRLMSIRSEEWPLLLRKYLCFEPQLASVPDISKINTFKIHLGQMGNQFPLSKSQRDSLVLSAQLNDGETLAVNGPPGTGKTTLLQSVYANHVVQSALAGKQPAAILTCSTNNQAITNVLDCCKKVPMPGGLFSRWLPDLESFGTYLISGNSEKQNEARDRGYPFIKKANTNSGLLSWYEDYLSGHQSETCTLYFTEKFKVQFPESKIFELASMVEFLKEHLIEICNDMNFQSEKIQDYISLFETNNAAISVAEEKLKEWLEDNQVLERDYSSLQILMLEVRSYFKTEGLLKKIFGLIPSVRREREKSLNLLVQKYSCLKEISTSPVKSLLLRLEALHASWRLRISDNSLKIKRAEECLSNYQKVSGALEYSHRTPRGR